MDESGMFPGVCRKNAALTEKVGMCFLHYAFLRLIIRGVL